MPDAIGAPAASPAAPTETPASAGAPAEGAPPAEPKPSAPLKRRMKLDGSEVEVVAKDEDDLWSSHRLKTASFKRMEEAARLRREAEEYKRQVEERESKWKQDPLEAWKEANPEADSVEFLTQRLQALLEEGAADPATKALRAERAKREAIEKQLKDRETREQEAEFQQKLQQEMHALGERFQKALDTCKLPRNDVTLELMAKVYHANKEHGVGLDEKELAQATREAMAESVEGLTDGVEGEALLVMFPKLTQRIHKALLASYAAKKGVQRSVTPPPDKQPQARTKQDGPKMVSSAEEFAAYGIRGLRTI